MPFDAWRREWGYCVFPVMHLTVFINLVNSATKFGAVVRGRDLSVFEGATPEDGEATYTVAEYRTLLTDYINSIKTAQSKLDAANTALTDATATLNAAKSKSKSAADQQAATDAQTTLNDAQQDAVSTAATLAALKAKQDEASQTPRTPRRTRKTSTPPRRRRRTRLTRRRRRPRSPGRTPNRG